MSELDDKDKLERKTAINNIRRRQELSDLDKVLSTIEGRRFLWRLLGQTKLFQSCYTGNNTTFMYEGMREVGLFLFADLQSFPEAYLQMMKEARIEEGKNA